MTNIGWKPMPQINAARIFRGIGFQPMIQLL
jgi:hypothetical protein